MSKKRLLSVMTIGIALVLFLFMAKGYRVSHITPWEIVQRSTNPDGTVNLESLYAQLDIEADAENPLFDDPPKGTIQPLADKKNRWLVLCLANPLFECQHQFLFFNYSPFKRQWHFSCKIDFPSEYYETPSWRVLELGGGEWVSIEHNAIRGTGIMLRECILYKLTPTSISEHARYLQSGHCCDNGFVRWLCAIPHDACDDVDADAGEISYHFRLLKEEEVLKDNQPFLRLAYETTKEDPAGENISESVHL